MQIRRTLQAAAVALVAAVTAVLAPVSFATAQETTHQTAELVVR